MSFHSKPIQSGWKKFWGKEFPEKKQLYRDKRHLFQLDRSIMSELTVMIVVLKALLIVTYFYLNVKS